MTTDIGSKCQLTVGVIMNEDEARYFEKGDVYVTGSRLVIGASIYYLNTITSIKSFKTNNKTGYYIEDQEKRRNAFLVGAISLLILLIGAIGLSTELRGNLELLFFILISLGGIGLVVSFILYMNSSTDEFMPKYHLSIVTAASEQQVYTTENADEMTSLVKAINKSKAEQV